MAEIWSGFTEALGNFNLEHPLVAAFAALVLTLLFLIALRIVRGIFRRLVSSVDSWKKTRIRPIRIQKQELLSSEDIGSLLRGIFKAIHGILVFAMILTFVNLILGLFPVTRGVALRLLEYVGNILQGFLLAIVGYLPNLLIIILVALLTHFLIKAAGLIFNGVGTGRIEVPGFYADWAKPTFSIVRFLCVVFALVVVFPYLPGADSPAFKGVSIFIGVLLSLGSTAAVANAVAGVVLTYTRAFRIGDRVRIADAEGTVIEKTLFVTRLVTPKNVEIAIPNSLVLANHVINYSLRAEQGGIALHTTVTLGYDIDHRKVEKLLIQAALETEGIEKDPAPFVHKSALDDFYVHYELNAYTRQPEKMAGLYSGLHTSILDHLHEGGIEILSPHYSAIRDGNRLAVPEDHLPKDYNPPPFRVHPLENVLKPKTPKE